MQTTETETTESTATPIQTQTQLQRELRDYVAACFAGVWVQTSEPDEAMREIGGLCATEGWVVAA